MTEINGLGNPSKYKKRGFEKFILNWYHQNKREFPWRYTNDPYKIMVSEILLQQTNSEKVVPIYEELVTKYSNFFELANADYDDVIILFAELGLFYRAQRLIDIADFVISEFEGKLPISREKLLNIKGIGEYTANAILCFGYNQKFPIDLE